MVLSIFVVLWVAQIGWASIPANINCSRTNVAAEKAICAHKSVSGLHNQLVKVYREKRHAANYVEAQTLKYEQRKWLKKRDSACLITNENYQSLQIKLCLIKHYRNRLNDFAAPDQSINDAYYLGSYNKSNFSKQDRQRWRLLGKWTESCEGELSKQRADAGMTFYEINNVYMLFELECEQIAGQSLYQYYLFDLTSSPLSLRSITFTRFKVSRHSWEKVNSDFIIGKSSFNTALNELRIHQQFEGESHCGLITTYSFDVNGVVKNQMLEIKSAIGNPDCDQYISVDNWPEIPLH